MDFGQPLNTTHSSLSPHVIAPGSDLDQSSYVLVLNEHQLLDGDICGVQVFGAVTKGNDFCLINQPQGLET